MSIEDRIDAARANRLELSPRMRRAHENAREFLNQYAIKEADFRDVYSFPQIKADLERVIKLQKEWHSKEGTYEKATNAVAEVLEAIILTQSELSEWLGNAQTMRSASFDDYVNGVDMVAEWNSPEDGSHVLALAVDITFGKKSAERKFERIRDEIHRGKLGSMKYFTDSRGDFMGTRNNVPRVVIGVSKETVEELAGLWINDKKKELGTHAVQRVLVEDNVLAVACHARVRNEH